ncbi:MAG TPA: phosphotyrosine protein phosphatase [Candidatus Nanoarchaeia archaeon]|nr:phosphotyrosine protein phosphatase [Candidatus Nanoarchaeia archaeon]
MDVQTTHMRVLFICNQNLNRSKTAEQLFEERFETKSAGLYNEQPVTEKQLGWADVVVVMEDEQRAEIAKRFPKKYMQKRILSLGIPDVYHRDQPELVDALKSKVDELL